MSKRSRNWKFSTLAIIAAAAAPAARAQSTRTWTGTGPDNLWTDASNWDTAVPGASDTASFTGSGSNMLVSLGGTTQSIQAIQFILPTAIAGYTLGVLSSGDTFNFGANGTLSTGTGLATAQIVDANITTNGNFLIQNNTTNANGVTGLTVGGNIMMANGGTLTLNSNQTKGTILVSGNITDNPGTPGSLAITTTPSTGSGAVNDFIITGNNTYSGTTFLSLYTGSGTAGGSIEIGTDSAFGTGKVSLVLHGNAPNFSSYNGSHTITNNFDFNGGPVFIGTNTLTFTGSMNIINSAAGAATRVINNEMSGGTVYFGTAGTSSTITVGNPVSNGGDGVGKTLVFGSSSTPGTTVVNDIIQDVGPGGGSSSSFVTIQQNGNVTLSGLNTYSGTTTITSSDNIIGIGSSSNGPAGSFTAGPFGTSTIILNNANGQHLRPLGGDRTVSNAITMDSGIEMDNAAGDPSNLILAGPITVATGGLIQNGYGGTTSTFGTLILGNATAAASTISLSGGAVKFAALNGPIVVNDVVQGGGTVSINPNTGDSGVVTFNAANTYSSTTTIVGGTLSVSSDGNLGDPGNAVTLSGGTTGATLLGGGTFTTARTINLSSGNLNILDATSAKTLTLTGTVSGGDLTKGTSGGTVELGQSGGYTAASNIIVNGGTLALGSASNGGATGPLTVGNTLTINSGKFAVLASGATSYGMTNNVNAMQINGSGQLNLANSALVTTTPYSTVQRYLTNGYNSGAWNGTGGISSSNAAADAALGTNGVGKALGFVSGTSQAGMNLGLSSGQTMVKYTIYGDSNLDGVVNILDFGAFSANFGHTGVGWEEGDYNYDGVVNILDFGKLSANFGHSATATVAMGGASVNTTLTGAKASSSASTVKPAATPAGSGVSVVVNTTTGDVQLSFNNIQSRGYEIDSPSGEMNTFDQFDTPPGPAMLLSDGDVPANDNRGNKYWIELSSDGDPTRLAEGLNTGYHFSTLPTINQTFDLGDIYVGPSGTNVPDLSVLYVDGSGDGFQQVVQYVGVPEPTTLGLMGLAAAGFMARRRRR